MQWDVVSVQLASALLVSLPHLALQTLEAPRAQMFTLRCVTSSVSQKSDLLSTLLRHDLSDGVRGRQQV